MLDHRFGVVAALLATTLALAVVLAITNLRAISEPALVDVVVPASALLVDGELVRGQVREGLPPYVLHWDGQPPSAVLVDSERGTVLAAAAFSDQSLNRQRNAVRFTDGEARFVLDARRWVPGRAPLVLRVEAVRPRTRFHAAAAVAVSLALTLLMLFAVRRLAACPRSDRKRLVRRFAESAAFLLIAAGVFASIYPGAPVRVDEVTDEANINSFAAALDHPERFTRDRLLSDTSQFAWYTPRYIGLIRTAGALGFHYQTANAFIGPAIALLLLFGLRRLFATVARNQDFGLAAALGIGLMSEQMPPGETWSILSVLPRMLFTALVPWVLLLALRCAPSSRRWWIACGAAGLLLHIHPVSAPVLLGALLAGFIAASNEPLMARAGGAALGVAAAAAAMLPYIIVYAARFRHTVDVDPTVAARALQIVHNEFANINPGHVLRELLDYRVRSLRIFLDGLAVFLLFGHRLDRSMRFYIGLGAGLLLVVFGVPLVDNTITAHLGRRPFQFEIVRGLRFLDLFLVGALALAVRDWRGSRSAGRRLVLAGAVCAVFSFGPGWFRTTWAMAGRARLSWRILHGRSDAASGAAQEAIRAVHALRASDERVVGPVGLRQFDVPLGWVWKDIGPLSYSPARGLLECADTLARGQPLLGQPITDTSLAQLSRIYDAQLLFLRRNQLNEAVARSQRVLFENEVYAIVDARPGKTP
jgi:hypothetical protein